jgi:hypothetical protein
MNEIGTAEGAGWGQGLRDGPVIGGGGGYSEAGGVSCARKKQGYKVMK